MAYQKFAFNITLKYQIVYEIITNLFTQRKSHGTLITFFSINLKKHVF